MGVCSAPSLGTQKARTQRKTPGKQQPLSNSWETWTGDLLISNPGSFKEQKKGFIPGGKKTQPTSGRMPDLQSIQTSVHGQSSWLVKFSVFWKLPATQSLPGSLLSVVTVFENSDVASQRTWGSPGNNHLWVCSGRQGTLASPSNLWSRRPGFQHPDFSGWKSCWKSRDPAAQNALSLPFWHILPYPTPLTCPTKY